MYAVYNANGNNGHVLSLKFAAQNRTQVYSATQHTAGSDWDAYAETSIALNNFRIHQTQHLQ